MNLSLIKVEEDVKIFKSVKTGRGPLEEGWREDSKPIMCRYSIWHDILQKGRVNLMQILDRTWTYGKDMQ